MRMRILTRLENSLANFRGTKSQTTSCELGAAKELATRMRMVLRMKWQIFVVAAEIPCEWMFATKFASDCECDGVVHSETTVCQKHRSGGH